MIGVRMFMHKWILLTGWSLLVALLSLSGCNEDTDQGEIQLFGPAVTLIPYVHNINKDLTADCGSATAASNTSSGEQAGSGSSSGTTTRYDIESYYQFEFGETLLLRYLYDENRVRFTLSPTTSTIQTCQTTDGINCDGVGTQTCETADNIQCGGATTVLYTNPAQNIQFQAVSGTINYRDGFSIDTTSGIVDFKRIEIEVIDRAGNVLKAKVNCQSNQF